jgi:eukaryotic-like serine/threonine-protein kinase
LVSSIKTLAALVCTVPRAVSQAQLRPIEARTLPAFERLSIARANFAGFPGRGLPMEVMDLEPARAVPHGCGQEPGIGAIPFIHATRRPMQPLPRIPGFELLTRLGGSLLTSVYSARARKNAAACAVKVINRDWQFDVTAVKLLQREARVCMAVAHPHLVKLIEAQVTKPPFFLVMEMLPGESLRRRLRRDYRLDVSTAAWIARQIAEALAALHGAGFAHGDIKPDNIRLVEDGRAILLDLGFAHRPGENAHLLEQGYVLGTVNYLAPELCGPAPEDGLACDQFSLGVTLFEMLSGQMPYPPGSIEQTFHRHQADPPGDISRFVDSPLQPGLSRLVKQLLARKPEDRPRIGSVVQQLLALEIAAIGRRRTA